MKIKNYKWNGFGFPVVFDELPAVKLRGELVPDIVFAEIAKSVIQFICVHQKIPFCGNQVKFVRMHLDMSLREFADFVGVTHQSVMRWEEKAKAAAHIDPHTEYVLRLKVLKAIHSDKKAIADVIERVDAPETFSQPNYRTFTPVRMPVSI